MGSLGAAVSQLEAEVYTYRRRDALNGAITAFSVRGDDGEKRVVIYQDRDSMNPREFDNNLWKFDFHGCKCVSGDKDAFKLTDQTAKEIVDAGGLVAPVYGISHGAVHLSIKPFGDPWDSGVCGRAYVTREQLKDNLVVDTERALEALSAELAVYDEYINGDVFTATRYDSEWEEEDGCGGFFGTEWFKNGLAHSLKFTEGNAVEVDLTATLPEGW